MRLYLSSFRLGRNPEELVRLANGEMQLAVIANAADSKEPADRVTAVENEFKFLSELGFNSIEIDLREYFGQPANKLAAALAEVDVLWVRGGNCFILNRAFKQSGLDQILPDLLTEDKIVYAGYSAGIDMLAPSLHGIELVDPPNEIPDGYDPEIIWEALGILPYAVAPHYKTPGHPETADIDKSVEYMIGKHIPFVALRDGEEIIWDGDHKTITTLEGGH